MSPLASFLNLVSGPDLIVVAFIALLLFGGKKIPEFARSLKMSIREFARGKDDVPPVAEEPPPIRFGAPGENKRP